MRNAGSARRPSPAAPAAPPGGPPAAAAPGTAATAAAVSIFSPGQLWVSALLGFLAVALVLIVVLAAA